MEAVLYLYTHWDVSTAYSALVSAEYTVENSWWWAEKMPETCRIL